MLALGLPKQFCVARHSEATRRFVCRYRGNDRGDHRDECYRVYTSEDCVNGGLSPESHAVLLCLLEKKVNFKEVKVRSSSWNMRQERVSKQQVYLPGIGKICWCSPRPCASGHGAALHGHDNTHATLPYYIDNGGPDCRCCAHPHVPCIPG